MGAATQWMGGCVCVCTCALPPWAPLSFGFNLKNLSLEGRLMQLGRESQLLLDFQVCLLNLVSPKWCLGRGNGEATIYTTTVTKTSFCCQGFINYLAPSRFYMNYYPNTLAWISASLHWVSWGPVLFVMKKKTWETLSAFILVAEVCPWTGVVGNYSFCCC